MKTRIPPWRGLMLGLALMALAPAALAVQISFPVGFPALRGTQIDVPITIGNVTGLGVYSFELQFTYSTNALTLLDVLEAGTLTAGWTANEYHEVNGSNIRIVAAGTTALAGSGTLLLLRFNLPLSGFGNSSLTWTQAQCRLNEGNPTLTFVTGSIIITNPPVLSFNPTSSELFAGDSVFVSVSGGLAPYVMSALNPAVGVFHQAGTSQGYFIGVALGTTQIQATDANSVIGTSGVFTVRGVKLVIPDSTILSGQTFLMPVKILLAGGGTPPNPPEELVAARSGDTPPVHPRLYWAESAGVTYNVHRSPDSEFAPYDVGSTTFPNVSDELPANNSLFRFTDSTLSMNATDKIFYLVTANGAGSVDIFSGQFRISWNAGYVELVGIQRTGTLTDGWSFQSETHPGFVDVSFSNQQALAGNGILFYLQLHVLPGGSTTSLLFSNALFNESYLAIYDNGTVSRIPPPTITISPGIAQETVVGDSIQFSASGGTAPYTWHLTNGATGTVSSTGKFKALAGGLTYVWANDVYGFTDSSGLVTVDDFKILAQNLSVHVGDSGTVSLVLNGSATGLGVYSLSISVSISPGWQFAYPITSGTMLNGWLTEYEANGSTIVIAASNGTPLTGSGTLLQLRGRVPSGSTTGNRTITLNSITLNEGNRRAYRVNGTLTITP